MATVYVTLTNGRRSVLLSTKSQNGMVEYTRLGGRITRYCQRKYGKR